MYCLVSGIYTSGVGLQCWNSHSSKDLKIAYHANVFWVKMCMCTDGAGPSIRGALSKIIKMGLSTIKSRLTTMGARSYSYAAPRLWNSLPLDIRNSNCLLTFKTRLKTYLFRQAFLWYVLLSLFCALLVYVQSLLCVFVFCSDLYFLFYLFVRWPWVFRKAP